MHWAKEKSTDEADALVRHLTERGGFDTDGLRHSAKVAWRGMALLQRELDAEEQQRLREEAGLQDIPDTVTLRRFTAQEAAILDAEGGSQASTEAQAPDAGSTPAPSTLTDKQLQHARFLHGEAGCRRCNGGNPEAGCIFWSDDRPPEVEAGPRLVTVGPGGTTYEPLALRIVNEEEQWGGVPVEVIDVTDDDRYSLQDGMGDG